jgi:N-methylhydantoinase B
MILSEGHASIEGDGHRHAPWPLFGGSAGATGDLLLEDRSSLPKHLPAMISNIALQPGDILRTVSPCGGGYGDPFTRDPQLVLRDVRDGLVSSKSARDLYGVSINGLKLDEEATAAMRLNRSR